MLLNTRTIDASQNYYLMRIEKPLKGHYIEIDYTPAILPFVYRHLVQALHCNTIKGG